MTIEEAVRAYESLAYTHHYIYGYVYRKMVYFTFIDGLDVESCCFDVASGSGNLKVRFRPNNKNKVAYMEHETYELCDLETWEAHVDTHRHGKQKNRGICFERLISERYGVDNWKPNNNRFDTDPDLEINGVGYQLKFQGAQIIELNTLAKMGVAVA